MTTTSPMTATDVALSLNGFDEIAIAKLFGCDYTELKDRPVMFLRSLMFVMERRAGAKDAEAYKSAMSATAREVNDYFPDETPDLDPDDPDTDEGKDDAPSE